MENTPIDVKLSLSRRIFDQNQKISEPKSPFYTWSIGQKNILRYCPPLNIFLNNLNSSLLYFMVNSKPLQTAL